MNCQAPEEVIACAIRESTRVGLFDYFSLLAVPIFLGLVTLAVAIASWRVARASHQLSLAIGAERERAEREARKLAIADQVYRWSAERWIDKVPDVRDKARRHAQIGRLSVALTESGLPGAGTLQEFLWDLDHATHTKKPKSASHAAIANSFVGGAFSALTEAAVIEWVRRPENMEKYVEPLRGRISEVLRDAHKKANKSMRRAETSLMRTISPPKEEAE